MEDSAHGNTSAPRQTGESLKVLSLSVDHADFSANRHDIALNGPSFTDIQREAEMNAATRSQTTVAKR